MPSDEPHDDRCAAKCSNGGYCMSYPVQGGDRCRMHGGGGNDGGAPEGNSNAVGSGEQHEGNFRALKTGDNVAVDRWIEFIDEEADDEFKELFRGQYERFIDRGADPMVATRLAVMWSKADHNNMELIKENFTRPLYHEGEYVDDVFDDQRDSSAIKNEREARMFRREEKLSPYSQDDNASDSLETIAEILGEAANE